MEQSLELNSEKIYFNNTKKYFKEVLVSYNNGCYRSAIVNLYIVTLTDFIYRFQELDKQYKDENSKDILKAIEDAKEENKYSPHWEKELIKETFKTSLIDTPAQAHVETLIKLRHLCAHPIIDSDYELFIPTKEMTRAIIIEILTNVLTKKVTLSSKVDNLINEFINDYKEDLSPKDISKELNNKYFSKMSKTLIESQFKKYWKFSFFLDNADCDELRLIHINILESFCENSENEIVKILLKNKSFFSKPPLKKEIKRFIYFLNRNQIIYQKLDEPFKIKLSNIINTSFDYKALSLFLIDKHDPNWFKTHLNNIITECSSYHEKNLHLSTSTIRDLHNVRLKAPELKDSLISFITILYTISPNFNHADARFLLLSENLNELNNDQLQLIVEKSNSNSQLYGRKKSTEADTIIKNLIIERMGPTTFDFSKYSNFG